MVQRAWRTLFPVKVSLTGSKQIDTAANAELPSTQCLSQFAGEIFGGLFKNTMNERFPTSRAPHVSILMATFNGGEYLAEQIDSVLNQTWSDWTLSIRDDGSQDDTPIVLDRYAKEYPSRIRIVPSNGVRLGADGNFARLLDMAEGPYFMFCDQDDVWFPEKIEKSLHCMQSLERRTRQGTPLLVYTDLRPADDNLRELGASVWRYGKHDPDCGKRLNRLLVQNMVFGCTIAGNSALKEAALPIAPGAVSYDWWLALVAVCLGRSDYVPEATMTYRLHGRNTVGATPWGPRYIWAKIMRFFDPAGLAKSLLDSQRQAGALLDRYEHLLREDQSALLKAYATVAHRGFLARRATLVRHGLFKTGFIRNVGLFARI